MHINTERLLIREFNKLDLDSVFDYTSDPKSSIYMQWKPDQTKKETAKFLKLCIKSQKRNPRKYYEFAIILKEKNKLIGGCGLKILNFQSKKGEIGYCLNSKYWGKGYATESARALLNFGFKDIGLHRISATCDILNKTSYKVMEKIGMKKEGLFREDVYVKGRWRDSYIYAILDYEWDSIN